MREPEDQTPPDVLIDVLRRLNRKERFWLLKQALGMSNESGGGSSFDLLSDDFRKELDKALDFAGVNVPSKAWWAFDYHIDWLAAALALGPDGHVPAKGAEVKNAVAVRNNTRPFFRGGNQDFDLVVAFDRTIIMCEAKASTGWSNPQMKPKLERLEELSALAGRWSPEVQLYVVLVSPPRKGGGGPTLQGDWAHWARPDNGKIPHIDLTFGDDGETLLQARRRSKEDATHITFKEVTPRQPSTD